MSMFDDLIPTAAEAPPVRGDASPYAGAISRIESGSKEGRYDLVGPATRNGDRALGRYQVMGNNVPEWTREAIGRAMTPQEFLASPEAQDAVFNARFGKYVEKYGPEGAAKAWFAGEKGMNNPNARDVLGTSVSGYARKFTENLGGPATAYADEQPTTQFPPLPRPAPSNASPAPALNFDDLIPAAPAPQAVAQSAPARPDVGRVAALKEGVRSGALFNFGDEVAGASAAGLQGVPEAAQGPLVKAVGVPLGIGRMIGDWVTGKGNSQAAYEAERDRVRQQSADAQAQYPGTYLTGQIAGAVALPGGGAAQGASLPVRLGRSAAAGAVYGGLSGAGEGDTLEDRAVKGATGATVGAAVGVAAVPALAGVEAVGRGVASLARPVTSAIRGAIDPEREAARRVVQSIERDYKGGGVELTGPEFAAAKAAGAPVAVQELGGETTRALARSAANSNPEARATLQNLADTRFEGQANRAATFVRNIAGVPADPGATRETLEAAARAANRPAYAKAYAQGQAVWDDSLEELAQAPVMQQAIRLATVTGKNRAALDGFPPVKNPFRVNPETGNFELQQGAIPNLQFWDHVKRNLDKLGPEGQAFSKALRGHLDEVVPSYADARAGAAKFFGAGDALEAGEKFVHQNMAINDARRAFARMSPAERDMFKESFTAKLIDDINNTRDRVNVFNQVMQSPNARAKIEMVMGPRGMRQLEALTSVEQSIDRLRGALGNSTTVRQFVELGLAGGSGGSGIINADPNQIALAGIIAGRRWVDHRVAKKVAEMLTSSDPNILAKGVSMVSSNRTLSQAFRNLDTRLSNVGAQQAPAPAAQALGISHAEGDQPNVPRPSSQ